MKSPKSITSLIIVACLLALPMTAFAKKGKDHFNRGLKFEQAQQWEQAAQEFTLALAADPSNADFQLHYRRSVFNASQMFMQKGRSLAEQRDYIGAYNAFRQAYGYDAVNQLATSEMDRMMRLQREKTGESGNGDNSGNGLKVSPTSFKQATSSQEGAGGNPSQPSPTSGTQQDTIQTRPDKLQVIKYTGDLKAEIRRL